MRTLSFWPAENSVVWKLSRPCDMRLERSERRLSLRDGRFSSEGGGGGGLGAIRGDGVGAVAGLLLVSEDKNLAWAQRGDGGGSGGG